MNINASISNITNYPRENNDFNFFITMLAGGLINLLYCYLGFLRAFNEEKFSKQPETQQTNKAITISFKSGISRDKSHLSSNHVAVKRSQSAHF